MVMKELDEKQQPYSIVLVLQNFIHSLMLTLTFFFFITSHVKVSSFMKHHYYLNPYIVSSSYYTSAIDGFMKSLGKQIKILLVPVGHNEVYTILTTLIPDPQPLKPKPNIDRMRKDLGRKRSKNTATKSIKY